MFYQTIHENKLIGGYLSRYPENALTTVKKIKNYIEKDDVSHLQSTLKSLNITYIVRYNDYIVSDSQWSKILILLNTSKVYSSYYHSVYSIQSS
jgi:hypothetical protein